jgi:hypothetical protein
MLSFLVFFTNLPKIKYLTYGMYLDNTRSQIPSDTFFLSFQFIHMQNL